MNKYIMIVSAFKSSGKSYSSETHVLGEYSEYPANIVYNKIEDIRKDKDHYCGLRPGSVDANSMTVGVTVLDDTDSPVCFQCLIKE